MDIFDEFFEKVTWGSKLKIGKYKGKTFQEVLEEDPKYLEWMLENITERTILDLLKKNRIKIKEAVALREQEESLDPYDPDF